jgi:hypothetical protein
VGAGKFELCYAGATIETDVCEEGNVAEAAVASDLERVVGEEEASRFFA